MYTRDVTSLQHPIVKHLVKLRIERTYREAQGTVLIPGIKLVQELSTDFPLKTLLVEEGAPIPPGITAEQTLIVPEQILKKVTGVQQPEPLAAEISLPRPASLKGIQKLLILDGISDPGNVGTLIRTAAALKIEGVFLTKETCDPFNEKALRAAKGATFKIPFRQGSYEELIALIASEKLPLWIAEGKGATQIACPSTFALALGNEAHGVSPLLHPHGTLVRIAIHPDIESLNVSAAGAILMDRLQRGTHV
ncbi:MAG: RNA methyltransferase [Rhabdochlamydiaceae bacterium]|nr:RNA methyltransferase [Rhabdochlamydiaceae bacterium]